MIKAKSHSEWPSRGPSCGIPDPVGMMGMQAVIIFRQWWEKAGAHIPWAQGAEPGMSSKPSREEMLDRWNTHTKFCPTCQKVTLMAVHARQDCAVIESSPCRGKPDPAWRCRLFRLSRDRHGQMCLSCKVMSWACLSEAVNQSINLA